MLDLRQRTLKNSYQIIKTYPHSSSTNISSNNSS
jgi:hypothetical protein